MISRPPRKSYLGSVAVRPTKPDRREASTPSLEGALKTASRSRRSWKDAPDAALVDACLDADDGAWEALVVRYGPLVHSIAVRCGLEPEEAADVLQTVFLIVYRKLGLLDSAGALGGWIATISRHEAWRAIRGRRQREEREGPQIDAATLSATDPRPDENLERVERAFLVQRGLARIDERCRGLIESMFWEQPRPSYEEMAARLGIQPASMPPTRARCLAKLRRALQELGWGSTKL